MTRRETLIDLAEQLECILPTDLNEADVLDRAITALHFSANVLGGGGGVSVTILAKDIPNDVCSHEWKPSPKQPNICYCVRCGACDFGDNDIQRTAGSLT